MNNLELNSIHAHGVARNVGAKALAMATTWHQRMVQRAEERGLNAADVSRATEISYEAIAKYFQGKIENPRGDTLNKIAKALDVTERWLRYGDDGKGAPSTPNASLPQPVSFGGGNTVPVYGQAMGGDDGYFILNGNKMADVLAPPSLQGVRNAYGVYVVGESMEPRYLPGEIVFVNPHLPVTRGDFVVVQIRGREGEPPLGYIKRFVRRTSDTLVLEQFNPAREVRFPMESVVSVHMIVMSGKG